jgi:hypothetical protein
MRKREPKLVEGPKNTLILRGNKTSNLTTQFLSTIVLLFFDLAAAEEGAQHFLLQASRYPSIRVNLSVAKVLSLDGLKPLHVWVK